MTVPTFLRPLISDISRIKTVCELGNKTGPNNGLPYRSWYEENGCSYVSIDWNGKDGAVKLDLQEPLDVEKLGGPFDLVTNFGTTEHVGEQKPCWRNVHNLVKVGGEFVNFTPAPTFHDGHGIWHPSIEWFQEFANINCYSVELLEQRSKQMGNWTIIYARLRKKEHNEFIFPSTPIHKTK